MATVSARVVQTAEQLARSMRRNLIPAIAVLAIAPLLVVGSALMSADAFAQGPWSAPVEINSLNSSWDNAVSCASATFCAVFDGYGDAELYNGVTWSTPSLVDPDSVNAGGLGAGTADALISCSSSSFCAASDGEYVLTYNGSTWSTPVSASMGIDSISCVSATFCVAVGDAPASIGGTYGVAITYDGSTWSSPTGVGSSTSTMVTAVSCASGSFCVATDNTGDVTIYNGSTWSTVVSVDSNELLNVSCPSATFCVAGDGAGNNFVYNGSSWSSLNPLKATNVSCASSSFCLGLTTNAGAEAFVTYNGSSWSSPTSFPAGVTPDAPNIANEWNTGPSCPTSTLCVGVWINGNNSYYGYASTFNGLGYTTKTSLTGMTHVAVNQQVTLLAKVTASPTGPLGTVTFSDGGTVISGCNAIPVSGTGYTRTASCTAGLYASAGTHAMVAIFTPSNSKFDSSSGALTVTVGVPHTRTSITESASDPLDFSPSAGAPSGTVTVAYAATVTSDSPYNAIPTGTVRFTDHGFTITGCSAVPLIVTGQASCTVSYSHYAQHVIGASYLGDFNASTTATVYSAASQWSQREQSGYLVSNAYPVGNPTGPIKYTAVEATITVPTTLDAGLVYPSSFCVPNGGSSVCETADSWVGIGDGNGSGQLIQAGVSEEVDTTSNQLGIPAWHAWYETPHTTCTGCSESNTAMDLIPSPGDQVHVTIEETGPNSWVIEMTDGSQTASQVLAYPISENEQTAEFIQELTNGGQPGDALTNTPAVLFQGACYATEVPPSGDSPTWTALGNGHGGQVTDMVLRNSTDRNPVLNNADSDATPSPFSPDKTGFYVAPYSDSSPAPPASGGKC